MNMGITEGDTNMSGKRKVRCTAADHPRKILRSVVLAFFKPACALSVFVSASFNSSRCESSSWFVSSPMRLSLQGQREGQHISDTHNRRFVRTRGALTHPAALRWSPGTCPCPHRTPQPLQF